MSSLKHMKRSTTPIARKTRVKPTRATPRRSGRVRNEEFLEVVRTMRCHVCQRVGPSDPDHMGSRPLGRKADDDTCVPMCRQHHQERTDVTGYFKGFACVTMREWCQTAISETRASVYARLGRSDT